MARRFTGKNRRAAKFLGVPEESFEDPGFCLGCGEEECECDEPQENFCPVCFCLLAKCTCEVSDASD